MDGACCLPAPLISCNQLQIARRELVLESAIAKLDRYDLLILDDIAYVTKDQAETSVLFELIAANREGRRLIDAPRQRQHELAHATKSVDVQLNWHALRAAVTMRSTDGI
jgi:hypothetical protein